jgi:hypothetical protein
VIFAAYVESPIVRPFLWRVPSGNPSIQFLTEKCILRSCAITHAIASSCVSELTIFSSIRNFQHGKAQARYPYRR